MVSGEVFNALDAYVWKLTYRWALRGHRNKPKRWIVDHHYGVFHPTRSDRWVFGDHHSGAYLHKFSWTPIVRHQLVKGGSSPYDPALTDYWHKRRGRNQPPLGRSTLRLLQAQHGRCPPCCQDYLLLAEHQPASPTEWEQWLTTTRKAITKKAITTRDRPDDHKPRLLQRAYLHLLPSYTHQQNSIYIGFPFPCSRHTILWAYDRKCRTCGEDPTKGLPRRPHTRVSAGCKT